MEAKEDTDDSKGDPQEPVPENDYGTLEYLWNLFFPNRTSSAEAETDERALAFVHKKMGDPSASLKHDLVGKHREIVDLLDLSPPLFARANDFVRYYDIFREDGDDKASAVDTVQREIDRRKGLWARLKGTSDVNKVLSLVLGPYAAVVALSYPDIGKDPKSIDDLLRSASISTIMPSFVSSPKFERTDAFVRLYQNAFDSTFEKLGLPDDLRAVAEETSISIGEYNFVRKLYEGADQGATNDKAPTVPAPASPLLPVDAPTDGEATDDAVAPLVPIEQPQAVGEQERKSGTQEMATEGGMLDMKQTAADKKAMDALGDVVVDQDALQLVNERFREYEVPNMDELLGEVNTLLHEPPPERVKDFIHYYSMFKVEPSILSFRFNGRTPSQVVNDEISSRANLWSAVKDESELIKTLSLVLGPYPAVVAIGYAAFNRGHIEEKWIEESLRIEKIVPSFVTDPRFNVAEDFLGRYGKVYEEYAGRLHAKTVDAQCISPGEARIVDYLRQKAEESKVTEAEVEFFDAVGEGDNADDGWWASPAASADLSPRQDPGQNLEQQRTEPEATQGMMQQSPYVKDDSPKAAMEEEYEDWLHSIREAVLNATMEFRKDLTSFQKYYRGRIHEFMSLPLHNRKATHLVQWYGLMVDEKQVIEYECKRRAELWKKLADTKFMHDIMRVGVRQQNLCKDLSLILGPYAAVVALKLYLVQENPASDALIYQSYIHIDTLASFVPDERFNRAEHVHGNYGDDFIEYADKLGLSDEFRRTAEEGCISFGELEFIRRLGGIY